MVGLVGGLVGGGGGGGGGGGSLLSLLSLSLLSLSSLSLPFPPLPSLPIHSSHYCVGNVDDSGAKITRYVWYKLVEGEKQGEGGREKEKRTFY
jgi:hypothetical protein